MAIVFRLMGAVARLNERMSHTRVNFIPINLLVMVVLGVLLAAAANETRDAVVNGQKPRTAPLGEVLAHRDTDRNYISVEGPLLPGVLEEQEKKSGRVSRTWGLMLDPEGARAIFVEFKEGAQPGTEPKLMTVTGMLVPLRSEVRKKLDEMGGQVEGVPIDPEYVLVSGRRPGSAPMWGAITAVSGVLLLLLVLTFLRKYVVFQKAGSRAPSLADAPSAALPEQGIDLRVTGCFVLDEKNRQRFLDVPAGFVRLDTGEPAFVSHIDASNKFMGTTTQERKGVWALVVQPDSLRNPETGTLYVGLATRPALRLHYADALTSRKETAILSFATPAEREALVAELNRAVGYSVVRT